MKQKIKIRLKEVGAKILKQAIENTSKSSFHLGDNDRGWEADLDFIIRSYEQVERLANMKPKQPTDNKPIQHRPPPKDFKGGKYGKFVE